MTGYKVSLRSKWAITDLKTPLRSWVHFCFTFDLGTSEWRIYLNGERREEGFFVGISGPLDSGGAFIIGENPRRLSLYRRTCGSSRRLPLSLTPFRTKQNNKVLVFRASLMKRFPD